MQTTFLSTRTSDCRGGRDWIKVFMSVCGNLQHIGQNLRFLEFCASLHERYDAKLYYQFLGDVLVDKNVAFMKRHQ